MVTFSETIHTANHATLLVQDHSSKTNCYNCVIETHQTRAFNLARRMLDDWSLAEDAVQESLVSAYRAYPQFMGDNLSAWLMCIVANTCLGWRGSRERAATDCSAGSGEGPRHRSRANSGPASTKRGHRLGLAVLEGLAAFFGLIFLVALGLKWRLSGKTGQG